jgi:hypothetical protein
MIGFGFMNQTMSQKLAYACFAKGTEAALISLKEQ